jgi:hypothetical protein
VRSQESGVRIQKTGVRIRPYRLAPRIAASSTNPVPFSKLSQLTGGRFSPDFCFLFSELPRSPQQPVAANLRSQSAAAPHRFFRSDREGRVHPIAGTTFFGTEKSDALKVKLHSDQVIETNATGDRISTKNLWAAVPNPKLRAKILVSFFLEESDLAFVPFFVAKVSVPGDSLSGDAFDLFQFDRGVLAGRLPVMTDEVVPGGNEQMTDLKIDGNHGGRISRVDLRVKTGDRRQDSGVRSSSSKASSRGVGRDSAE